MELEGESSRADSAGSVAKRHRLATARSSNDDADKNFEHQDRSQIQEKENQYSERFCFACNRSLERSRHFINIAGQKYRWHPECFKCNVCKLPLDRETTCHVYKDEVVCRQDYARLRQENSIKCSRCRWAISASDWVRKAGKYVYHLACFSCDICMRQLSTGEQFTISVQGKANVRLLCRLHFAIEPPPATDIGISSTNRANSSDKVDTMSPAPYDYSYAAQFKQTNKQEHQYLQLLASTSSSFPPQQNLVHGESELTGVDQHPELADDTHESAGGNCQQTAGTSTSSSTGSTSGQLGSLPSKSKRVRTTFTEDQLSILQTHFQIDSNPDGQDLERIATITGLSKRVTQVWFQNSRARQKKYLIKRKPSSVLAPMPSSAAIGLAGDPELQAQFGAEQHHTVNTNQHQHDIDESSAGPFQQKWSANVSDRSDLSTTDGCAALDDLDEDSRTDSEERLLVSADSND